MAVLSQAAPVSLSSLIQRENRHGGICVLHVQAGVPAERRASLLVDAVGSLPSDDARHVLLAFSPGTELCCTSLWALSHLSDRCAAVGGTLAVSGLGETTLSASQQAGLARRFMLVDDVEEGISKLLSRGGAGSRAGLRRLFGRAA